MNLVLEFIRGGGIMMYPLVLCSIILLALTLERAIMLRKMAADGDEILDEVRPYIGKDFTPVVGTIETQFGSMGRILARGLKNAHRSADAMEMAIELEASNEIPVLEANLPIIKTIVNISPLLGLLGTIAGMIASFRAASAQGLGNPSQILGGISEALISTATGITIAVIGFIVYNYFANQTKKMIEDIEYYGSELVNLVNDRVS